MSDTPKIQPPKTAKHRILGKAEERQRVDGQDRYAGDVVEMTEEAAEFYLREMRIEPVEEKSKASLKAIPAEPKS